MQLCFQLLFCFCIKINFNDKFTGFVVSGIFAIEHFALHGDKPYGGISML